MGKKLFRFQAEAAARIGQDQGEAGARQTEERMLQLIRRDFSEDQVALLRELTNSEEGAAHYNGPSVAVEEVHAPEVDMMQLLAEQTGLRVVDLRQYTKIPLRVRAMITPEQAKTMHVLPLEEREDGCIVVAIADPSNPMIADDLRLILGREVEPVIAGEAEINERIEQYYGMAGQSLEDVLDKEAEAAPDENVIATSSSEVDIAESSDDQAPIIKLVNVMLMRAINDRASDIHIEPFPTFIRIRYRVDGVLREIPSPPRSQLVAIVSRIKVMSNMNISETRMPQDGRMKLVAKGREIDMRVSTVPTVHGESIVMRVLDKSMMMIGISQIGMIGHTFDEFMKVIRRPNGIVLVTGPTGSGKTTTLYASLAEVRDPGEKLITTEDPVEYEMDGIQQVNINEGVGLTFARCLRSILRQDPDTVLVGEIRDAETAQIAVQASLTGHLVFSTLHTNSAAATITRLLDMGVEPFLITSSLEAVVGQRLVRTICQNCKRPYKPSDDDLYDFGYTPADIREQGITFHHGEGCPECSHTGYHGRLGIFELMVVNDAVRELILERATTDEIHELAIRQGMTTMRQDGWLKACMGITTLSEVARQTPRETEFIPDNAEQEEGADAAAVETPELAQPERGALPRPAPKLDERTMMIEDEAAAPAFKPDGSRG